MWVRVVLGAWKGGAHGARYPLAARRRLWIKRRLRQEG